MQTARDAPKEVLSILDSISYQSDRLTNIRSSDMTEILITKLLNILSAIVNFYSVCLGVLRKDVMGKADNLNLNFLTCNSEYNQNSFRRRKSKVSRSSICAESGHKGVR
jgi:hypothetical protein